MRHPVTALIVVAAVLALVPDWSGEKRLDQFDRRFTLHTTRVPLDPADPARVRVGRLTFLGGVALAAKDPAFGGYSALAVRGDRFTLLSDGGTILRFSMGADWRPHGATYANLADGPSMGWQKQDRDSESLAVDPATGRAWVGFERWNAIGRYAPGLGRGERLASPAAMRDWPDNGGPEAMVRLRDGRFVLLSETGRPKGGPHGGRDALVFPGDPTLRPRPAFRFVYRPPRRYDPSDATELPDGRLLVLNRRFALPFTWSVKLTIVARADLRPGRQAVGREIATIAAPLTVDNYEGVAVTREGDATILWLVSDDNQSMLERTLLMKFRLAPQRSSYPHAASAAFPTGRP